MIALVRSRSRRRAPSPGGRSRHARDARLVSALGAALLWLPARDAAAEPAASSATDAPHTSVPVVYKPSEEERDAADESLGKGESLHVGEREHEGFFLRLSAGPGAGRTRYDERIDGTEVSEVTSSGLAGVVEVAVGGRAVGNLIVHGNAIYTRYNSPTRLVDGVKDAALPVTATAYMLGAGASYYFMPYNVYLSGALGLSWQVEERKGGEVAGNTGFFATLAAGKEWWVGKEGEWGLGAQLRGLFAAGEVNVAGAKSTSRLGNLALAFCATFN